MTRRHRLIMSLALLVGVVMMLLFPLLNAFAPVLLVSVLFNAFFAPVSSFADSATMVMLAGEEEMYGRIRLGGTIGYGLTAPIVGMLVQNHDLKWAFWGCAALFLLAFIVSQKLVYSQVKADDPARRSVRVLLANPRWLLFLSLAVAICPTSQRPDFSCHVGGGRLLCLRKCSSRYGHYRAGDFQRDGFRVGHCRGWIRRRPVIGKRGRARSSPRLWSCFACRRGHCHADSKTPACRTEDIYQASGQQVMAW